MRHDGGAGARAGQVVAVEGDVESPTGTSTPVNSRTRRQPAGEDGAAGVDADEGEQI